MIKLSRAQAQPRGAEEQNRVVKERKDIFVGKLFFFLHLHSERETRNGLPLEDASRKVANKNKSEEITAFDARGKV